LNNGEENTMPIIIILLVVIICLLGGGPLFVAGFAGAVLAVVAAFPALTSALLAILALLFALAVYLILVGLTKRTTLPKRSGFRVPLTEKFKRSHQVEHGIWKDDIHFIVEADGVPNYFTTLERARLARDTGIIP